MTMYRNGLPTVIGTLTGYGYEYKSLRPSELSPCFLDFTRDQLEDMWETFRKKRGYVDLKTLNVIRPDGSVVPYSPNEEKFNSNYEKTLKRLDHIKRR